MLFEILKKLAFYHSVIKDALFIAPSAEIPFEIRIGGYDIKLPRGDIALHCPALPNSR